MRGRPLRFCMITTFFPPYNFGGDGIFVSLLANALAERGYEVTVIHCTDAYQSLSKDVPQANYQNHTNVTVHQLHSAFGFLSPLLTQQTGLPILKSSKIRAILKQGFDVIHYHNISLIGGPKILEYGQAIKLYTIHEYWLICQTHILYKNNQQLCTKPECFSCALAYRRPPQWWRYFTNWQSSLKHVDRFISPSQFGIDIHKKMGFPRPMLHIPNFVLPTEEINSSLKSQTDQEFEKPFFLFVGRLEKLKGLQTLIPIFRNYEKAQLVIAGKGNYEPELRAMAAGSNNITFLGYQSSTQLQSLYRKAIATIVPSVCYELFSMVTLEAFRARTPVITRDIGGVPELIKRSGGGFIYTTDQELLIAIERLLTEPLLRKQIGENGYQAYLQYWTPEIYLTKYLALIDEIAPPNYALNFIN